MEEFGLSLTDIYGDRLENISRNSINSPIAAFVLEGMKMKTPEVKLVPELRNMAFNTATRTRPPDDGDFSVNPEPVPFQQQNFILPETKHLGPFKPPPDESSTSLKKVPIPKRHLDTFGGYEYTMGSKRGVILHTDRYQWDSPKIFEGLSQRERMRAELEYMERLRGIKRRRELLPHRSGVDLLMGGRKVEFVERFDIQREIQKLKSLVMPQNARDLFHGRGLMLPSNHSSVKPRQPPILDYDSEEDLTSSAPASLRLVKNNDRKTRRNFEGHLPRINTKASMLGLTSSYEPILMAREKRTVEQIKARISIPAGTAPAYMKRSRTQVPSKFDSGVLRSSTSINKKPDKELKVTTTNDAVKRVDLHSASTTTSRQAAPVVTVPEPEQDPANTEMDIEETPRDNVTVEEEADLMEIEDQLTGRQRAPSRDSKAVSPTKAVTPNPLKGSELAEMIPENERNQLAATFKKLDTDDDGHLKYNQVQTQLPKQMSTEQENFLKEVYNITSNSTFFGVDEFLTMSALTKTITTISNTSQDAFKKLNFDKLHDQIIMFVDLFQSVDNGQKGKISLDALKEVLTRILEQDLSLDASFWNKILDEVSPSEGISITKVEFLAHIPYFLSLRTS